MVMWKFGSCPRCMGDVFLDTDEEHNWYEQCLQCGYRHELKSIEEFIQPSVENGKQQATAGKQRRR
jgi:Zn ribbon nucleic-acid-binding protein